MSSNTVHVGVVVGRPAPDVAAYIRNPRHLPEWAAGLASGSVERVGDRWIVEAPFGRIAVEFAPANDFGIVDHIVTLEDGSAVENPMRVIGNGDACDVVFTVRRRPGMDEAEFSSDVAAVTADLHRLKSILEG